MSVSVGQRVQSMIDHMSKGEIELALSDICIAIDITSQKYYNEPNSSASCYKRFLKENIWLSTTTTATMTRLTAFTLMRTPRFWLPVL